MKAVLDLSVTPTQFDGVTALAALEVRRVEAGAAHLDLIVYKGGKAGGFKGCRAWPKTAGEAAGAYENIIKPTIGLMQSVRSVEEVTDADGLEGLPGYHERLFGPENLPWIWASPAHRCLRVSPPVKPDPRLVTITLREASHWPQRNSDLSIWMEAARVLRGFGWRVRFVRDAEKASEDIPGFECDPVAAVNVRQRAIVYSKARLNLMVNGGPMVLAVHLGAPLANFRPVEKSHPASSPERYAKTGWPVGAQPVGVLPSQRWVWERETGESIIGTVKDMIGARP